jgi:tetratricopeptide (TPR) repeat protein
VIMRLRRWGLVVGFMLIGAQAWGQSEQRPSLAGHPAAAQTNTTPAQTEAEKNYEERKKFAIALFNKQLNLEALPIFEELARQNPGDTQVLVGLGACLIAHSVTVKDASAASAERLRAREILLNAKQLGSNSGLLPNLLDNLPADGSARYPGSPAVSRAIADGEAAFAKNDYDEAIKSYSIAFDLDPKSYSAALFIGDCYFAEKDVVKATEWYEKAIAINPDTETAYRYEADMYTKNGDQARARKLAIQSVVAEPYVQITWRGLAQWANANQLQLMPARINTHNEIAGTDDKQATVTIDPNGGKNSMAVWIAYYGVRMNWRKEEFKKHYPQEAAYRHTLAEEVDALKTAAAVIKDEKPEALATDKDLLLLKKVNDAAMLEPYALFTASDAGVAADYVEYRSKNRAKLEEYLSTFVVPPAQASTSGK